MHPSRIFSLALILFLVATFAATLRPFPDPFFGFLLFIAVLVSLSFFWKIRGIRILLILILFVFLGIIRTSVIANNQNNFSFGERSEKVLVWEESKTTGKYQQVVVKRIDGNEKIILTLPQFPVREIGEALMVEGKFEPPEIKSFQDKAFYLSNQISGGIFLPNISPAKETKLRFWDGIYVSLRRPLSAIPEKFEEVVSRILSEPQAGLLSGILWGSKANLDKTFLSALAATGTVHIIALSGYNITVIAEAIRLLSKNLPRKLTLILPAISIILFVLAAGISASVVRAAIMGIILLLSGYYGRQSDALVSVLFASFLMVLQNPLILVYDVGFQLSFAAVCGILFLSPSFARLLKPLGFWGPIFSATLAAQILAWPITSFWFGSVSLVAPVANLFILPFVPFVMLLGFVISGIGWVSLWAARLLAPVLWFFLSYFIKVIEFFGSLSFVKINYRLGSPIIILGYYLLVLDLILVIRKRKKVESQTT